MEDKRQEQCTCGSRLKCRETINEQDWIVCVGVGCNKKWLAKREDDKKLQVYKEIVSEFHG